MGLRETLLNKPFTPVRVAIVLTVLLALWLAMGGQKSARVEAPESEDRATVGVTKVEVRWSDATLQPREVVAQGHVLPWTKVVLTAQVSGRVDAILKAQGERANVKEPLLRLSDEGRSERLQHATALVKLRETELTSARALEKSRFVPETQLRQMESALAQAQAEWVSAKLDVEYGYPSAPFSGMVDRRHVEHGQWVTPGQALMDLVQIDKLKVVAYIAQQDVAYVQEGQSVRLQLLDGRQLMGQVRFISYTAENETRSFYVEVVTENTQRWRIAGASVTLHIQLPEAKAHRLSPALLSLGDQGQLGIVGVNDEEQVVFYPVKVLAVDNHAATLIGLPDRVRVITLGAGFVQPGETVEAVEVVK